MEEEDLCSGTGTGTGTGTGLPSRETGWDGGIGAQCDVSQALKKRLESDGRPSGLQERCMRITPSRCAGRPDRYGRTSPSPDSSCIPGDAPWFICVAATAARSASWSVPATATVSPALAVLRRDGVSSLGSGCPDVRTRVRARACRHRPVEAVLVLGDASDAGRLE